MWKVNQNMFYTKSRIWRLAENTKKRAKSFSRAVRNKRRWEKGIAERKGESWIKHSSWSRAPCSGFHWPINSPRWPRFIAEWKHWEKNSFNLCLCRSRIFWWNMMEKSCYMVILIYGWWKMQHHVGKNLLRREFRANKHCLVGTWTLYMWHLQDEKYSESKDRVSQTYDSRSPKLIENNYWVQMYLH